MTFVKLEDAVKPLELARNRLQRAALEMKQGSRERDECWQWADEAHEALQALRSLPMDDGVTDEMVERARKAVIETANWRNMRGIDEGSPLWGEKVARAALQAALGPLPAPPSD